MKRTGIVRNIDELGRIVLPKELRDVLDIQEGESMEFFFDENSLVVRKYSSTECVFCKTLENTIYFKERFICHNCMKDAGDAKDGQNVIPFVGVSPKIRMKGRKESVRPASIDHAALFTRQSREEKKNQKSNELQNRIKAERDLNPNIKQKELALLLGISQGKVSQLLRM